MELILTGNMSDAQEAFRTIDARRFYWRAPDRHILAIVDFRSLADLTTQPVPQPINADLLDEANLAFMDDIDQASLFTWCRHLNYRDAINTPVGNLCNLISLRFYGTPGMSPSLELTWNFAAGTFGAKPSKPSNWT